MELGANGLIRGINRAVTNHVCIDQTLLISLRTAHVADVFASRRMWQCKLIGHDSEPKSGAVCTLYSRRKRRERLVLWHDIPVRHDSDDQNTRPQLPAWVTSKRVETPEDVAFLSGAALSP